jgi:hypothetical protein
VNAADARPRAPAARPLSVVEPGGGQLRLTAGRVMNATNARAASGEVVRAASPAEYTVTFWRSGGNGPTRTTPFTGTISADLVHDRSASPLATFSAG